jgi:hypothetical protein
MSNAWIRVAVLGAVAATLTAGPVRAADDQVTTARPSGKSSPDSSSSYGARMEDLVVLNLAEKAWVGGDFAVTFRDGTATLTGTVPTESAKARMARIARETRGVTEVRNNLQVKAAAGLAASVVPDNELARRVARQIAAAIPGSKAGEDWWFEGWRVEGPDNTWNVVVEAENGRILIDGDVPRVAVMRKAVDAARQTPGVQSVRSDMELERFYGRYPYGRVGPYAYGPYGYPFHAYEHSHPDLYQPGDIGDDVMRGAGTSSLVTLSGRVSSLDRQTGDVTLQTDSGAMELSLPGSALSGVQVGETLTVRIDTRESAPAASPAMNGDPRQRNLGK